MRSRIVCSLFWCLVLVSPMRAQTFEVPVTVSDGANSVILTLGIHSGGTDGFDAGLDEFAPPPPPAGAFDARSVIDLEAYLTDIRDNATTEKAFHLRYQASSGGGPIVLTWDSDALSGLGSFFITDDFTGALFGPLDMTATDQLDVSSAGGVLDDRLRILVTPGASANTAPLAEDDVATTAEDVPLDLDVLANDTDADGDALTVTHVADPAHGTAVINSDGTVRYTPEGDFNGTDAFFYSVADGNGGSAQAQVSLTITPDNDAPVFTSTPVTGATVGQPYHYTITAADIDGDLLTLATAPLPAWLSFSTQHAGTAALDGTPGSSDVGTHEIVVEVSDGEETSRQAFTIIVSGKSNSAPAPEDDQGSTGEDTSIDLAVLANDTDADGDALSVMQVTDPEHGLAAINADGTIHYTPDADYHGTDAFTYTVRDPDGLTGQATVTLTITPVNDAPAFASAPVTHSLLDQVYRYVITTADVDGDVPEVKAPTRPAWLGLTDHGDGTATLEGTPGQGDLGDHEVVLEASDGTATVRQRFTITVSGAANLPPTATAPTTPADGATVLLEGDPGAVFAVTWNAASDPDGDTVTYRWQLSLTRDFTTPLYSEDTGTATRFETTVGAVASALTAAGIAVGASVKVFHRVVTRDGTSEIAGPIYEVTLVRGVLVGVEGETPRTRFALLGNYPNPFQQKTTIRYELAEAAAVRLVVYDATGRQVAVLVDARQPRGTFEEPFDASGLRSGTYFYRLETGPHQHVKAMVLLQ